MVYKWKSGSRAKGDAQTAGEVCAQLEERGCLDAQTLVNVSRPKDAPLHDSFEWDDAVAGEEWRRHQARHIIRSVVIADQKQEPMRAFFSISTEAGKYSSVQAIVKEKSRYDQLLSDALSEIKAFRRKYNSLVELNTLFEAIDKIDVAV